MANNNISMDERMSKHEKEFTTRFSNAITQMADEGIELALPIVVIEHIHKSENNLSVVRSQVRSAQRKICPRSSKKMTTTSHY